jgi:hypothetical protein
MSTFDLIRVVNTGDEPLVLKGNTVYTIPVGKDRIIPFADAAAWFGDPRLDNAGKEQLRTMQYRSLQFLWGYTEGMTYPRDRWNPAAGFKTWDDFKPKFECYDMDGERVYMILDDPDGTQMFRGPRLEDPAYVDKGDMQRQIELLTQQVSLLTQLAQANMPAVEVVTAAPVTSVDAVSLPEPVDEGVTEDAPQTIKAGRK